MDSNVVKWLFLPDHLTPPNPLFLLCKIIIIIITGPEQTINKLLIDLMYLFD